MEALRRLLIAGLLLACGVEARAFAAPLTVFLHVGNATPVADVDFETDVRITAAGDGPASLAPPRLFASVGHFDDLTRVDGRTFVARYVLPRERYPQAAILAAEVADPRVRGHAVVRIRATASPSFHTDPGAAVTVRVGDRDFGPQQADRDGQVRVTVVVPPGVGVAHARSVNEYGKTSEQEVDLSPPPFPRLLLLAPPALTAGSVNELAVVAIDGAGGDVDSAGIVLRASQGRPHPLGGEPGMNRFLIRAPTTLEARTLILTASLKGEPDSDVDWPLPVMPGPAATLTIRPDRTRIFPDAATTTNVFVSGRDLYGNPTPAGPVAIYVDGQPAVTRPLADGRVAATFDPDTDADRVDLEAMTPLAYAREVLPIMHLQPGGRGPDRTLTPRVGLALARGRGVGKLVSVEALARSRWLPPTISVGLSLGFLDLQTRAIDPTATSEVEVTALPLQALGRVRLYRRAPVEVAAVLGVGAALVRGSTTTFGYTGAAWRFDPAGHVGLEVGRGVGSGVLVLGCRYFYAPVGELATGDRLRGNAAGLVLDGGYRLGF